MILFIKQHTSSKYEDLHDTHDDMALVLYWMRFSLQQIIMALEVDMRLRVVRYMHEALKFCP